MAALHHKPQQHFPMFLPKIKKMLRRRDSNPKHPKLKLSSHHLSLFRALDHSATLQDAIDRRFRLSNQLRPGQHSTYLYIVCMYYIRYNRCYSTWKKDQEIMAALQYKPQPQWKIGKKKYKPRLIMARVRYLLTKDFWQLKGIFLNS